MSIKLTDSRVQALRPGETVVRVFDSLVPGFHVRVTPAGSKSFCITFQRKDGGKIHLTLGEAAVWKTEAAREKAASLRQIHDQGGDARAHLQDEREAKDLRALVKVWRDDYRPGLKPTSQVSYDSLLKDKGEGRDKTRVGPILALLGNRLVKDISYEDVKALHRKERIKGQETNANRAVAVLSRLLGIAEKEGWRPLGSNPCGQLEKPSEKARSRVLSAEEYAALEAAICALEKRESLEPQAGDLIRFLALSGLRKGEALALQFTDVDLERSVMRFEDHKTSEQAGVKVLPLNTHLQVILQRRAAQRLGPYVFPGRTLSGPIVNVAKMWARLLVEAKLVDVTPHDLRRTFMSTCCELGYPAAIGDCLLGHSLGKIRDTYINLGTEGIIATASQETADWIAAAMAGKKVKAGVKFGKKPGAATV